LNKGIEYAGKQVVHFQAIKHAMVIMSKGQWKRMFILISHDILAPNPAGLIQESCRKINLSVLVLMMMREDEGGEFFLEWDDLSVT
jgi:hypothetical protein